MGRSRVREVLPTLLLPLLVLIAYGAALSNGYVWDDRWFLVDFAWLDSPATAVKTAFSPLFMAESYVRPLPLLSLYVDNLFGEHREGVSHAVNIFIHVACTFLVYLLAVDACQNMSLTDTAKRWAAFAPASLFAVHPALSEAVVWVSSRFDLFVTLFMLTGLWCATRDRLSDGVLAVCSGVVFFLAALSKELAAVYPLLLAVFVVLRTAAGLGVQPQLKVLMERRWLLVFAALLVAGLIYLFIRFYVLGGAMGVNHPSYGIEQWVRTCAAVARYVQMTVLPFVGNSPQHSFSWNGQSSVFDYILQISITALLVICIVWLLVSRQLAGWVLLAWSIGYLLVVHLVPINIGSNLVQQRFMYLPTAVLLATSPYALGRVSLSRSARRTAPVFLFVFLLAFVLVVRSIVPVWQSDFSLWRWARQADPASAMARENLIWAYLDTGMYEELDSEVEALRKDGIKTSINGPINVGVSYHRRGDMERALYFYSVAENNLWEATPLQRAALYSNMAAAYARIGEDAKAVAALERALAAKSESHLALANLLVFCNGRDLDLSGYREVTVRRAQEAKETLLAGLRISRPNDDLSALCPQALQVGK